MIQSRSYLSIIDRTTSHWLLYLLGIVLVYHYRLDVQPVWFTGIFGIFINHPSTLAYAAAKMVELFEMIKLFAVVVFIHKQNFKSLVTANKTIRWKRISLGFLTCFAIELSFIGFHYLKNPAGFTFSFTNDWFVLLPIVLILTPIQTSFEEFFFRGYLIQGMATVCRSKLALIIVNGLIFTLIHIRNPEVQRGWILLMQYFIAGAFLAYLAIRDNGLELGLGIHAAHNLLIILFFNTRDSAAITPSIWQIQPLAPSVDVLLMVLEYTMLYYIFFGRKKALKTLPENG